MHVSGFEKNRSVHLAQMGNGLDLLRNKEPMHLHSFPINNPDVILDLLFLTPKNNKNVQAKAEMYHYRIKRSQGSHFSFSNIQKVLQNLNI